MNTDETGAQPVDALCAANTNAPKHESSFNNLAARRAWLDSLPDKVEPVLAWPTYERLAHLGDATKVGALMRWRDLTAPTRYIAANDNAEPEEGSEVHDELHREIRPTIPAMMRAAKDADVQFGRDEERHIVRLGNLVFNFDPERSRQPGLITEWGTTAKGAPLKPIDRTRSPKGAAMPKRSAGAVAVYLALPAAIPSLMAAEGYKRPMHGERGAGMYDPLQREEPSAMDKVGRYGVEEARTELVALGLDGNVKFADLPFSATRCPEYIMPGPQWKGGVSAMKGAGGAGFTTAGDCGHHHAAKELARTAEAERLRKALGKHADVLDMAISDSTAEDIGIASGLAASSAKRRGAAVIDKAIQEFLTKIAA